MSDRGKVISDINLRVETIKFRLELNEGTPTQSSEIDATDMEVEWSDQRECGWLFVISAKEERRQRPLKARTRCRD